AVRRAAGEAAPELECSVQRHADLAAAARALSALLAEHRRLHPGALLVALQAALPSHELRRLVPALEHFPVLEMAANEALRLLLSLLHLALLQRDGQYPAFGWFQHQAALFVQYALNAPTFLDQCIELTRYARSNAAPFRRPSQGVARVPL